MSKRGRVYGVEEENDATDLEVKSDLTAIDPARELALGLLFGLATD